MDARDLRGTKQAVHSSLCSSNVRPALPHLPLAQFQSSFSHILDFSSVSVPPPLNYLEHLLLLSAHLHVSPPAPFNNAPFQPFFSPNSSHSVSLRLPPFLRIPCPPHPSRSAALFLLSLISCMYRSSCLRGNQTVGVFNTADVLDRWEDK